MPAKSEKQRKMMAIAEHHPEKLYKRNRVILKMNHKQLHDFASKTHHSAPDGEFLDVRMKKFNLIK